KELRTVSINGSLAFDRDVVSVGCRKHHDVAVAGRNSIAGPVMLFVTTAQEAALRSQAQGDIALQFKSADQKIAGRDQDNAAPVLIARIDRSLDRGCIECGAIAFRAEIAGVVDAGP